MLELGLLEDHLTQSAKAVLNTMCFLQPFVGEGPSHEDRQKLVCMQVSFKGPHNGRFVLGAGDDTANVLAPAFLGSGDEDLAGSQSRDVLAEMANIICGATVSHIEPEGLFRLGSPELVAPMPAPDEKAVELALDCGCGLLLLQLSLDKNIL